MIVDYINIKIIDRFENDRIMQVETTQIGAPKLTYNGSDDKYQPIMAAEFSFNLTVTDRTDGKFFHLYTGNEKRYYVLVEDQSLNMLFEGYLLPDFYEEPYKNGVIFVNLVATDGIGLIKGQYLPNLYYKKETSVIKLIAECLRLTKLEKQICFAPAIVSAATNYRWDEIAVNGTTYLDGEIKLGLYGIEVLPSRKNAYDILELLLKNIGCSLYGQSDKWYIEGINRKHETSQLNEIYNFEGVYVENQTLTKNVVDVTFFANPTVSIKSPWKRIDVSWDCDEDGELIPDWAIEKNENQPLLGNHVPDVLDFWKSNGLLGINVFSDQLTYIQQYFGTGTVTAGNFPYSFIAGNKSPKHLNVFVSTSAGGSNNHAQNPATLEANYIDVKNKKYLKISDEYIDRKIDIEYKFGSIARFIANNIDNAAILNVEEKDIANSYKNEFTVGTSILASSKVNDSSLACKKPFAGKSDNSFNYPDDLQYLDYFDWQPYHATADLKLENLSLVINGFFNAKLHAPISPDFTQPYFYGYVVQQLKVQISELKKWQDSLIRSIDFTTTYDIDIFHGDSIADLTEKQFRFRRPIFLNIGVSYVDINILSVGSNANGYYVYFISYSNFIAIQNNPELFTVSYMGEDILMNDLNIFNPFFPNPAWSVYASTFPGYWLLQVDSNLITYSSGIGSNVNDFNNLFIAADNDVIQNGFEFENNEWRESWKRYGQTEIIRYGIAIGKMYHDVQPGPLAVLEGTATNLVFPREIMQFQWMDVKQFIPTRMDIDFSQGRSNILMIESKHEIITDYVN
jgi:hypothetical protein